LLRAQVFWDVNFRRVRVLGVSNERNAFILKSQAVQEEILFGVLDTPEDLNPQDVKTRKRALGCPVAAYRIYMDCSDTISNLYGYSI
jgi:hypothetical protein